MPDGQETVNAANAALDDAKAKQADAVATRGDKVKAALVTGAQTLMRASNDFDLRNRKHANWDILNEREMRLRQRSEEMRQEADRASAVGARDEKNVAGERTEALAKSAGNLAADSLGGSAGGGAAGIARMQAAQQTRDKEGGAQLDKATDIKYEQEQKGVDRNAQASVQRENAADTAMANINQQKYQQDYNNADRIDSQLGYEAQDEAAAARREAALRNKTADQLENPPAQPEQPAAQQPPPPVAQANTAQATSKVYSSDEPMPTGQVPAFVEKTIRDQGQKYDINTWRNYFTEEDAKRTGHSLDAIQGMLTRDPTLPQSVPAKTNKTSQQIVAEMTQIFNGIGRTDAAHRWDDWERVPEIQAYLVKNGLNTDNVLKALKEVDNAGKPVSSDDRLKDVGPNTYNSGNGHASLDNSEDEYSMVNDALNRRLV